MDISYRQGDVWKAHTQLAEWNKKEQIMEFIGEEANFTTEFNAMMEE